MQFNENPTHPVHSAANLALEYFDKKFPNKKRKKANLADVPGVEYEKLWGAFCDVRVMFVSRVWFLFFVCVYFKIVIFGYF